MKIDNIVSGGRASNHSEENTCTASSVNSEWYFSAIVVWLEMFVLKNCTDNENMLHSKAMVVHFYSQKYGWITIIIFKKKRLSYIEEKIIPVRRLGGIPQRNIQSSVTSFYP